MILFNGSLCSDLKGWAPRTEHRVTQHGKISKMCSLMNRNEQDLNSSTISIPPADLQEKDKQEEKWTIECIVDEAFLNLARTTEIITVEENDRSIPVKKYYRQARDLMKWIPIAKPSPEFVINICDLTPKVRKEIESISTYHETLQYVITQAVGRIFENLDFEYYHLSIARNLRVRFEP